MHGNLASTVWWQPTLKEWKRTVAPGPGTLLVADWRGCGQNEEWPGDQTFSIEDLARDFLHLLDEQGIQKTNLVGHSLGGLIALQMMILAPDRFDRAVLLDPVGAKGVVFDDSMYEAFRQMAASRELTGTVIMSTVMHNEDLDGKLREKMIDDAFKAVRGIGTSVLEILKTVDLREDARQVRVPTLILHGQHDAIIPMHDAEELERLMPKSKLEKVSGAGHCWNVEDPEAFTRRLKEWFA
jgi:pimeloyl-ACP methyl ester carboxylesterase